MKVYRLEFLQPDGRWTGPCTAEYMTVKAFALRDAMLAYQKTSPRHPIPDNQIFAANPGHDRYVCGTVSVQKLFGWFGGYLVLFMQEGGYIAVYEVPLAAIGAQDEHQVIYQQRRGIIIKRSSKKYPKNEVLVERIHPSKLIV